MPAKRLKLRRMAASLGNRGAGRQFKLGLSATQAKLRRHMPVKSTSSANEYLCAIEKTQNGKYNVRVRAAFGRGAWSLPVYFLASSFDGAMKSSRNR